MTLAPATHSVPEAPNEKHSGHKEELKALVKNYKGIDSVKPVLKEFLKKSDFFCLLYDVFEHHLSLAKTRSQALGDGQITVYDKALLELTNNGTETYNLGAFELFLDEVMGMKSVETVDLEALVIKNVAVKSLLVHATRAEPGTIAVPILTITEGKSPNDKTGSVKYETTNNAKELKTIKDSLSRILATFSNAQQEYKAIPDSDVVAKSRAAKFLRDTAENALTYMHSRQMKHHMAPELEVAFQMAKEKATALSGGRKRRFEVHDHDYSDFRPSSSSRGVKHSSSSRHHRATHRRGDRYPLSIQLPVPLRSITPALFSVTKDMPSPNSSSPLNPQLTPEDESSVSRDRDAAPSNRAQPPELRTLQTNFEGEGQGDAIVKLRERGHHDFSFDESDEDGNDIRHKETDVYDDFPSKGFTIEEERRVVRKFDRKLTMFMALLYMLSFLDRSNIGNARIAGLENDLRLTSSQFECVLTAFYITYISFEWMMLMYKVVPAHIYVSLCCFSWGLIAACQSLVSSFWALVLLRALLGTAEAAFGPGLPFYLSFFYKREELAYRTGMFISAAPLATSFASTLAWVIVKLSKDGPIAPWRSLFLLEGFPSIIVAIFAWIYVPDSPGRARYLTPRERKIAKLRLKIRSGISHRDKRRKRRFDWSEIWRTLRDPKSYLTALMFFSCNVAFSSMPVFLPTILKDMGYSTLTSQALSAPPYILSFVIVLLTASLSDRRRTRSPYIITHALISSCAYLAIALTGHFHTHLSSTVQILIRYIAIYPAAAGFFSAITVIITWTMDNQPAKEGKGTGMAILNIIGQCGPLVGTRLYPDTDGPWYVRGMAVCALFMLLVAGFALALKVLLQRENKRVLGGKDMLEGEEIEMAEGESLGLIGRGSNSGRSSTAGEERNSRDGTFIYIV
ncbi:hypothetical protein ACO22_05704 [Paracoccidioides brasiliensis]|uniref:Major facilitator superfamily (MFS) profile domain-containing protein n=1 Tax=Paracoccidioides brasiliensis TaxID=121759 RepID=A0A1D2J9G6_PARBR|nr:hypothetical protein ACO22_05704 [Paracoccidioides brasiliensis]